MPKYRHRKTMKFWVKGVVLAMLLLSIINLVDRVKTLEGRVNDLSLSLMLLLEERTRELEVDVDKDRSI